MRDPHVEFLLYSVSAEGGTEYVDPEPLVRDTALGRFEINGGKLRIEPSEHFGDEDEARKVIDPFLKAWEVETDLVANPGAIRFRFETAHVIDRDPPPPGSPITLHARGGSIEVAGGQAHIKLLRRSYPPPPEAFRITPEVEIAFQRWRDFRDGKVPLLEMAYFVLTLVENNPLTVEKVVGSPRKPSHRRRKAAEALAVDLNILNTLGELSSAKGDAATARKVSPNTPFSGLSGSEKAWVEQAVQRLIRRLGERASGVALEPITIRDLPLP